LSWIWEVVRSWEEELGVGEAVVLQPWEEELA